tara:strand:- start:218 stop:817 length:600 start_codon:yes stop_codon:yes gene_type:complete
MKSNNVIEKIKDVLNLNEEVKLEQQALENGTVLEADSFEADNEVFIVTEDERVAVPVGEYQLEDGRILVVAEEGIISEVKEAGKEEEVVEEVEAEEDDKVYATKEELAEVKEMIEEIKAMLEPKEDLSSEDLGNLITEELSKHELSEVPQEVQEKLNEAAAEPIMANPEADSTNKPSFKFAQNRKPSTLDRVLNKIINN